METIIIGAVFGLLLGICVFGMIDVERQIKKLK
jgi:hypothetical protein